MPALKRGVATAGLVPKLRFPGFATPWSALPLPKVYFFVGRNTLSRSKLNYIDGPARNIHYGDIHTIFSAKFDVDQEQVPFINWDELEISASDPDNCLVGDVILADASEDTTDIGKAIEIINTGDRPLLSGLHTIHIRPKDDEISVGFGAYLFAAPYVRRQIQQQAQGAKVLGLSQSHLSYLHLPLPNNNEQRKITACLTSIDEHIETETCQLDALNNHKQGLLQHLFPQVDETAPSLRFPEFRHSETWKIKKGAALFRNRVERGNSNLPVYSVTLTDGMVPRDTLDRHINDIADPSKNKAVMTGDIAYNMMRMWQGACGVAPQGCMVSPAYIVLKPTEITWPPFFGYLFKTPAALRKLRGHSRGLTADRLRLYFDDFGAIEFAVPEIEEQKKIAACLSSLDDLIAAQSRKIDLLKQHKKGLMQQLFPTLDQVDS